MKKENLLVRYSIMWSNYTLAYAAVTLFSVPRAYSILEDGYCTMGRLKIDFKPVKKMLDNVTQRDLHCAEFLKMAIRTLIGEAFESAREYCERTRQLELYQAQPWYHFARLVRNNLSHGGFFKFRRFDKSILPITFGHAVIDASMEDQPLDLKNFTYVDVYELFQAMKAFIETSLQ